MDFNNGHEQSWNWQGEDHSLQKETDFPGASQSMWNGVALNGEDLSYMLDEATPVKACGDLAYHVKDGDTVTKEPEVLRETFSQVKRRRMLQFDTQVVDSSLSCEESTSAFLKPNEREEAFEEVLPDGSQWLSAVSEDVSASSYDDLDQSSEGWLAECFNDSALEFSPDDMNFIGASDGQIDISDFCNVPTVSEDIAVQQRIPQSSRNVVFKGRRSFIRTPTKLASSVVYPFAFIKPCSVHGDVTLKDINQRIRTPPPSKLKQTGEDPSAYPTSAFSGKPVVGKTKIRTEGGKGSITIMRTKG